MLLLASPYFLPCSETHGQGALGTIVHSTGITAKRRYASRPLLCLDQAFQASGHHLLGQKELSMGRDGRRRILVAELSAVVTAAPADGEKAVGLAKDDTATHLG